MLPRRFPAAFYLLSPSVDERAVDCLFEDRSAHRCMLAVRRRAPAARESESEEAEAREGPRGEGP